jgi:hypothetical protein
MGVSANQVTSAMILNIANIRVKNNMIIMVSDLPRRHELHGQIRNKRNIRDMERVKRKSVIFSYKKEGIHRRYEQYNDDKKVVKKKDEKNDESYEKKRQNQDTKNKYLEKEW